MSGPEPDPRAVDALFDEACRLAPEERADFLERRCADPRLRARVGALLERLDLDDDFLEGDAARLLPNELPCPERIGPYEIEALLGAGGMGVVYRATHPSPRRPVALKVLHAWLFGHESSRRFEHEASLLARLEHPSIARLIELGTCELHGLSLSYIAMELVEGEAVTKAADARGLGRRARVELLVEIADAVHHAHLHGVVHRDLKPSNVLLDANGRPKVIDFGVARALDGGRASASFTRTGQVVGTLAYMSPEQIAGDRHAIDARTDVYSLGVLAFELLSGSLPHELESSSITRAARLIQERAPRKLREVRPEIPRDLECIVDKALAKEPARRYQSVAELSADLGRFLRGEAIEARPASALYQLSRLVRRNPLGFGGAAVALLALVAAGGIALHYARVNGRLASEKAALASSESRARAEAEERAKRIALLSDADRLSVTSQKAAELEPAGPGMEAALDAWLNQRAEPLRRDLPLHEERLAELRLRALPGEGEVRFDEPDLQEQFDATASLVRELHAFFEPETGLASRIAESRARIDAIREQTLESEEARAAWDRARDDVASMKIYAGLELRPQEGLLPLRRDPRSGLWEFWHPQTGARPIPSDDDDAPNAWKIDGTTGLVFVLIPGGRAWIGEQAEDPNGPNYYAGPQRRSNFDELEFAPFFLSKYELTQAQWKRLTGENPSEHDESFRWYGNPPRPEPLQVNTAWNPVEQVSWLDADRVLGNLGLRLPTGFEWEYAARAGTETPWWSGADPRSIEELHAGNLADAATRAAGGPPSYSTEPWLKDGWAAHAPVGTFAANPFGLHDVIGNLWEWCEDAVEPNGRMLRGGSYVHDAALARASWWDSASPELRSEMLGLRPARSID